MAVKSATIMIERYKRGLSGASESYKEGVQNPKRSWQSELTGAKTKMVQRFTESMNNGTFENGVSRKGDAGWKTATLEKASNYSTAQDRAVSAFSRRAADMYAVLVEVNSEVEAMPRGTLDQNLNRMTANARGIHERWKARRGR